MLALYRERGLSIIAMPRASRPSCPEKRSGLVFVFRTFDRVSYALVLDSDGPVTIGDSVRQP